MGTRTFYSNSSKKQSLRNRSLKVNKNSYELVMQLYHYSKGENIREPRLPKNDFRRPVPARKPTFSELLAEHIVLYKIFVKKVFAKSTLQYS